MPPFQPKGERARRAVILEMAAGAAVGDLLSYDRICQALGLGADNSYNRQVARGVISSAKSMLLKNYGRVLVAQRGTGYRIALPGELATIAQTHRRRADRQVNLALAVVQQADTSGMTPAEYQRFIATRTVITDLHKRVNNMQDRLGRLEQAVFGPPPADADGEVIERHDEQLQSQSAMNDARSRSVRGDLFSR